MKKNAAAREVGKNRIVLFFQEVLFAWKRSTTQKYSDLLARKVQKWFYLIWKKNHFLARKNQTLKYGSTEVFFLYVLGMLRIITKKESKKVRKRERKKVRKKERTDILGIELSN